MIILLIVLLLLLVLIVINTMRIKALKAENERLKDAVWESHADYEYENEARQMRAEYEEKARKLVGVEARKSRVKGNNP